MDHHRNGSKAPNGAGAREAPEYGRRLLVNLVDERARATPDREWLLIPRSSRSISEGWKVLTYAQGAEAVNRMAYRISDLVTPESVVAPASAQGQFPTVAYIGPQDVRYVVFALAAVKAGCQALFVSPRNSLEGQVNLFEKTACRYLFFDPSFAKQVRPWLSACEPTMTGITVGPVDSWFAEDGAAKSPPFPYNKTFEEAEWDPMVVLHTSGSTGLPKPIVVRQGMLAMADKFRNLPDRGGAGIWTKEMALRSKRMMMPMPLFHALGVYLCTVPGIYYEMTMALGMSDRPLSADLAMDYLDHVDVDSIVLPAAIVVEMSQSQDMVNALKRLSFLTFGGAGLSPEAGNRLVEEGVQLVNIISSTECIYPLYWQANRELWQYHLFDSEIFGCEWRKSGEDGVVEQVIVRKDKASREPGFQGIFYTFPDIDEYSTNDLFRPHPTEPNNWIYYGRADNILVLSSGLKLNPVTIEDSLMDHPGVKGAMVVGVGQFQPALILEPVSHPADAEEEAAFLDSVWPFVVKANKHGVAHGQIHRELMAVSNPAKPFLRAGKGSVQRALTMKLYADEIKAIFDSAGSIAAANTAKLDLSSEEALVASLQGLFRQSAELDADTDFFSAGVDSTEAVHLSRMLRAGIEAAGARVDASVVAVRVIYRNATLRKLGRYLYSAIHQGGGVDGQANGHDADEHEVHAMESLIDKYTRDMRSSPKASSNSSKPPPADDGQVLLITGTTGALGSYLLDFASSSPRVKKIICLNRSEDGKARQTQMSAERGLSTSFDKAEFLQADLSQPLLGLDEAVYARLLAEVDRVIHNSWPVNFNLPVESFDPHLRGVRHLADLSAAAAKRVPVVFMSSIGSVGGWREARAVPEESIAGLRGIDTGYGRSKLVGSMILERARDAMGVPVEIVRVGQIAGPAAEQGCWNRHEWLPALIASSVYLGVLPDRLGPGATVDWTPVEGIASLVLEVSGVLRPVPIGDIDGFMHGVNPCEADWASLAAAVLEFYDGRLKLVGLDEWVAALERSSHQAGREDMARNPGVKLLDTYRGMAQAARAGVSQVRFDMSRTKAYSPTMQRMQAVTPELMKNWCRQWGF